MILQFPKGKAGILFFECVAFFVDEFLSAQQKQFLFRVVVVFRLPVAVEKFSLPFFRPSPIPA